MKKYNKESALVVLMVDEAKEELQKEAEEHGFSLAKYVRRKLFPDKPLYW